jgi:uncharacterized protein YkwD
MKLKTCTLKTGLRALAITLLMMLAIGTTGCKRDAEPLSSSTTTTVTDSTPTQQETDVIKEMNYARTKPKEYVEQRLQPLVGKAKNSASYEAALEEVIDRMNRMNALPAFTEVPELHRCAKEWVEVSGPSGYLGHDEKLGARFNKYCRWTTIGENCSYGLSDAKEIVIQLLVDDGVSTRGHRDKILSAAFTHAGAAIGSHKQYRTMCCIDFASGYYEK